ncbi:MAG: hypothetical protein ABIT37_16685 [Luteolibacter sp.]
MEMKSTALSSKFSPGLPGLVLLLLLGWSLLAPGLRAESRTWRAADGREMTGEFVKVEGDSVTVRRLNGKTALVPVAMLNSEDQKYVATKKSEKEAADQAAADEEEARKKPKGSITYKLSGGSEKWPEDRKKAIVAAMDAGVEFYNKNAGFKKELTANNSPGTPTADSNYDGWINWGQAISRRVALHEIAHTLGIGTHPNWQKNIKDGIWTGKNANEQLKEFDGKDAVLHADRMHFWPYGLNFDNESDKEKDLRHIRMVEAMRKDMGIK